MKYLICLLLTLSICSSCKKDDAPSKTVVSAMELVITDPIPADVSKIRLTNVADNTFSEKVIDSSEIGEGQLGITVPLYSAAEIDAKITVYYTDGKTADKIISAVKIEPGKKTVIKGSLLSQNVTVDWQWGEDILISF